MKINLLKNYPSTKRNLTKRNNLKSKKIQNIAKKFGKDYFDGKREYGYGGYYYHKKFWKKVVKDFKKFYKLTNKSKILDIGCGKGFMVYDLKKLLPKAKIRGIDISKYAIKNSKKEVKHLLKLGNAKKLQFKDNTFDLIISINTLHNLNKKECSMALKEINRVSKKNAFITVDAYNNAKEKKRMYAWNLTAKTIMHEKEWIKFFKENNYKYDYYWFKP
jgi:ubiquinone/menaquinone biosynthesis C-methylase UbiE